MSLDTFEKRLGAEGRPLPGGLSQRDRWAIAGTFFPSNWSDGLVLAGLGALAAAFVGTNTGGTSSGKMSASLGALSTQIIGSGGTFTPIMDADDRFHVEGRLYPATFPSLEDRFAIGYAYRRVAGITPIDGKVSTSFGALGAAFGGSAGYSIFFDVDYAITVGLGFTEMTPALGAVTSVLGSLGSSLRGTALPPDSVAGIITATLSGLVASFAGTMTPPAARSGRIHCDLGSLDGHVLGSVVPPQGNIGEISANLAALSSSLVGSFAVHTNDGELSGTFGALTGAFFGQALLPGDIYGFFAGGLGSLTASLRGTTESTLGGGQRRIVKQREANHIFKLPGSKRVRR